MQCVSCFIHIFFLIFAVHILFYALVGYFFFFFSFLFEIFSKEMKTRRDEPKIKVMRSLISIPSLMGSTLSSNPLSYKSLFLGFRVRNILRLVIGGDKDCLQSTSSIVIVLLISQTSLITCMLYYS